MCNSKKYKAVLDFEFTVPYREGQNSEILSIGAVIIDSKNNMVALFDEIVKPSPLNRKLSKYCTALTGITQEMVDKASYFSHVYRRFLAFLDKYNVKEAIVWGDADKTVLQYSVKQNDYISKGRGFYKNIKDIQREVSNSITYEGKPNTNTWSLIGAYYLYVDEKMNISSEKHNAIKDAIRLSKIYKAYLNKTGGIQLTEDKLEAAIEVSRSYKRKAKLSNKEENICQTS